MQYIGPGHGLLQTHVPRTLAVILNLYVETPAAGLSAPISWRSGPNLCFSCTYVLNKPNEIKESVVQSSYGESYRGRPSTPPV